MPSSTMVMPPNRITHAEAYLKSSQMVMVEGSSDCVVVRFECKERILRTKNAPRITRISPQVIILFIVSRCTLTDWS